MAKHSDAALQHQVKRKSLPKHRRARHVILPVRFFRNFYMEIEYASRAEVAALTSFPLFDMSVAGISTDEYSRRDDIRDDHWDGKCQWDGSYCFEYHSLAVAAAFL